MPGLKLFKRKTCSRIVSRNALPEVRHLLIGIFFLTHPVLSAMHQLLSSLPGLPLPSQAMSLPAVVSNKMNLVSGPDSYRVDVLPFRFLCCHEHYFNAHGSLRRQPKPDTEFCGFKFPLWTYYLRYSTHSLTALK